MDKTEVEEIFKVNNLSDEEYRNRYEFMKRILYNGERTINEIHTVNHYFNPKWEDLYQRYLITGNCSYYINCRYRRFNRRYFDKSIIDDY